MSDDEEYYDEYDEDIFWIEEPDPEIAVSLKHHTTSMAPYSRRQKTNPLLM